MPSVLMWGPVWPSEVGVGLRTLGAVRCAGAREGRTEGGEEERERPVALEGPEGVAVCVLGGESHGRLTGDTRSPIFITERGTPTGRARQTDTRTTTSAPVLTLTRAAWRSIHPDFRNDDEAAPRALVCENGATVSVPVRLLTDEEAAALALLDGSDRETVGGGAAPLFVLTRPAAELVSAEEADRLDAIQHGEADGDPAEAEAALNRALTAYETAIREARGPAVVEAWAAYALKATAREIVEAARVALSL